ncbi:MAG: hypothetical protein WDW36_004131 [Sanguina aurantia]
MSGPKLEAGGYSCSGLCMHRPLDVQGRSAWSSTPSSPAPPLGWQQQQQQQQPRWHPDSLSLSSREASLFDVGSACAPLTHHNALHFSVPPASSMPGTGAAEAPAAAWMVGCVMQHQQQLGGQPASS